MRVSSSVPLIIGWKLNKRGPTIPLTRRYQVVEVEGLAKGDQIVIWGVVHDGEYVIMVIEADGIWEVNQGSSRFIQAELVGQHGSEAFVWLK